MPQDQKSKHQESAAKIILILMFTGGLGFLAWIVDTNPQSLKLTDLSVMDLVLIGFATFRLGRMIAFDRIMDPIRKPFTRVVDDSSGEGKTVVPQGRGVRGTFGQLLSCPICVGTWVAAFFVLMMLVAPQGTRMILYATAAVGLAEILNSLNEALCWIGRGSRTASGLSVQKRIDLKAQSTQHRANSGIADSAEKDW